MALVVVVVDVILVHDIYVLCVMRARVGYFSALIICFLCVPFFNVFSRLGIRSRDVLVKRVGGLS